MAGLDVVFTRKRVRNINLRVQASSGAVHVSAPLRVERRQVEAFVASRLDWIEAARLRVLKRRASLSTELETGSFLPLWGQKYRLEVIPASKARIVLESQRLLMHTPADSAQESKQALLDAFYREQLVERLPDLMDLWQPRVGVQARECRIRRMKSRWGSCNIHKARIWLSLELAKYPPRCLEYVLVHELTHLLEPSHNRRFHNLVAQVMPDWKSHKVLLDRGIGAL